MYFYLISDRFKILKRSKKSTFHKADHSLTAGVPAALHVTTLSQSSELMLTQSYKPQATDSEGEGSDCELASFPGPAQLSSVSGESLGTMLTEIMYVSF